VNEQTIENTRLINQMFEGARREYIAAGQELTLLRRTIGLLRRRLELEAAFLEDAGHPVDLPWCVERHLS
jgi:hypothetical protein